MEMIKKHVDTVVVVGSIVACMMWMNGKFSDVEKDIASLKTEISIIKTVLLIKDIYPRELASVEIKE